MNDKISFTPGPWICHSGSVWKDGPTVFPRGADDGIPIARMARDCEYTMPVERDANAQLIAAAPDLLVALHELREAIHDAGLLDVKKRFGLCTADAMAGTAIYKAIGEM